MDAFAANLRTRARQLGLSDAEVARRAGLGERRYAHYASGKREPDLATVIKISTVLGITPNELLGVGELPSIDGERTALLERLQATAASLTNDDLRIIAAEADAIITLRNSLKGNVAT